MVKLKGRIVTRAQLRELGQHLLDDEEISDVWTPEPEIANVSAIVDPQADDTDPVNPDFVPQDKVEFEVAVRNLVRSLPNEKLPELFTTLSSAIKASTDEVDEDLAMKQDDKNEKLKQAVEEAIRLKVRHMLQEMRPGSAAPAWHSLDYYGEEEGGGFERGGRRYDTATDVDGSSFKDLAGELGGSVSGAKRINRETMKKAQFVGSVMNPETMELITIQAMQDYVDKLAKSGDLSAADTQLMMDHPDIVRDLDGFREHLDKYIKREMKKQLKGAWNWNEQEGWTRDD